MKASDELKQDFFENPPVTFENIIFYEFVAIGWIADLPAGHHLYLLASSFIRRRAKRKYARYLQAWQLGKQMHIKAQLSR